MRLIDATALLRSRCSALDGEHESCEECLEPPYGCCCLEIKGEDIYNAPTIDAIPVEWLKELTHHNDSHTRASAKWVLGCWKRDKEQEAR